MTPKELNNLVKKLQNGDMVVFDAIYYETKSLVYYTILQIVKDRSLAEDIMQDTYLKSLEKIHTFKPTYSFKSWIVMIARNLSINEFNRRKRELSFDISEDEYIFGSVESTSEKELIVKEMLEFLKPEELEKKISELNFSINDISGLSFNPIVSKWKKTDDLSVNYIITAKKN